LTALVTATLILVSTVLPGSDVSLWWFVYRAVPGAQAIRAIARIGLVVLIGSSVGLAFLTEEIMAARRWLLLLTLTVAIVAEQGQTPGTFEKTAARARAAGVAARIDPRCRSFFLVSTDPDAPGSLTNLDAMWAQMLTRTPTVNGYSGSEPPGWHLDSPAGLADLAGALESWRRRWGLTRRDVCWIAAAS
jgi:hypothetical protein